MHELSLIQGVIDTVQQSAAEQGIIRISKVKVVVGKLTMVLPDSLNFAFEALKPHTPLQHASLVIEQRDAVCSCGECRQSFTMDDFYRLTCPRCGGHDIQVQGGDELYIDYYEGE